MLVSAKEAKKAKHSVKYIFTKEVNSNINSDKVEQVEAACPSRRRFQSVKSRHWFS